MNKVCIPKLRFSGFEGEWEEKKLGNITKVTSGGTPSRNNESFWNGDIPWITTSLINFNIITTAEEYITQEAVLKSSAKLFNKGTILMAMYGQGKTRGKVAVLGIDATTNQACGAIIPNDNLDKNYLFQNLAGRYDEIRDLSNEGGQQNLSGGIIKEIKLSFPSLHEQQKIASFLSSVDEKIQQLSRKKELLEQYKKGVMQQLFSGKLRFKDDNGSFRKGKLGDFGYFYYGKGAPKTSVFKDAKTPCVRYGELYSTYKEEIKFIKSYTNVDPKNLKLSKGGEVLVPRVGEDPRDFANCSYLPFPNVAIGEMISVYNTKENGLFMTYYINAMLKKQLAKLVEGGNVSNLYFRYVETIDVEIPSLIIQQKIVDFLSGIDAKIENVGQEINTMQGFKKGLLQQLFV